MLYPLSNLDTSYDEREQLYGDDMVWNSMSHLLVSLLSLLDTKIILCVWPIWGDIFCLQEEDKPLGDYYYIKECVVN